MTNLVSRTTLYILEDDIHANKVLDEFLRKDGYYLDDHDRSTITMNDAWIIMHNIRLIFMGMVEPIILAINHQEIDLLVRAMIAEVSPTTIARINTHPMCKKQVIDIPTVTRNLMDIPSTILKVHFRNLIRKVLTDRLIWDGSNKHLEILDQCFVLAKDSKMLEFKNESIEKKFETSETFFFSILVRDLEENYIELSDEDALLVTRKVIDSFVQTFSPPKVLEILDARIPRRK